MAEMELASSDYFVIKRGTGAGIVTLTWTERSSDMTDTDFKAGLTRLANIVNEYRSAALLVDVSKFGHTVGELAEEYWRIHVVPEYNNAGVRKMAYIFGEGADVPPDPVHDPSKRFKTKNFADREDARDWVLSY
jgi:hypothetical protein